jgi:hypothetical protein
MLPADQQGSRAVLARLDPLVPILYRSIEAGVAESLNFFGARGRPVDPYLQPNIVRWKAKQVLDAAGHDTQLEDGQVIVAKGLTFHRQPIANNGLQVSYGDLLLRILKMDGAGVPLAGPSRARQSFYEQLSLFEQDVERLKLLVLWSADAGGLAGDLFLVCPRRGAETRQSLEVHWVTAIPHPADRRKPEDDSSQEDQEDEGEALYRLPLESQRKRV